MSIVAPLAYPLHETTLPNGLRVIVSPDHAVPFVAVNLWYDVGSRDETPGRTGLAHLFEHVMFQGSKHVASGEHFDRLQAAGATGNATTWFDRTNYFESVPTGVLDLALWLEADRMGHLLPALTQTNLDTQREVVKEEKRQRYDNAPYGDLIEHLIGQAFPPEHPYGHTVIGSMADLDAASLADAHAFFTTWYSPSNAVLTLVGDVEPADAFARAARYFGHLPRRAVPDRTPPSSLPPHAGVPRQITSADVPESALYAQWRTPARGTPDQDAIDIALTVLGGSETSRLHRSLVRDQAISSGAGASAIPLAWGTSLGFAFARVRDGADLSAVEDALVDEVTRLCDEGPTPEEVRRAHVQFEREWLSQCARIEARADLFSAHATLHGDPGRVNRRILDYTSIAPDAVTAAARTWLRPEQRAIVEYHRSPKGA
ncbi:MAG: pitrilysin family protein [Propioniciclava sp.]|uniref:M16 family metallopeptidase n=1 Tax=Propioniciclava sp. TaxID=2038686 RepID=UPI0039E2E8CF